MMRSRRQGTAVVVALSVGVFLAGCGSDPVVDAAEPTQSATVTSTASPTARATPSVATTSPAPTRSATTRAATPKPTASPTDDENGELAGQVIIEYPGKPLRRTSSTTPNESVRDLQVRLNEVGYPVKVTGLFNAETERVVIRFQRDDGLKADGIVGPSTWAALFTFEGGAG